MALSCRLFRIIAVLVISGNHPSSGPLQLCGFTSVSIGQTLAPPLYYSTSYLHLGSTLSSRLSSRTVPSPRRKVYATASQTTAPGYHTLFLTVSHPRGEIVGQTSSLCCRAATDAEKAFFDVLLSPQTRSTTSPATTSATQSWMVLNRSLSLI